MWPFSKKNLPIKVALTVGNLCDPGKVLRFIKKSVDMTKEEMVFIKRRISNCNRISFYATDKEYKALLKGMNKAGLSEVNWQTYLDRVEGTDRDLD